MINCKAPGQYEVICRGQRITYHTREDAYDALIAIRRGEPPTLPTMIAAEQQRVSAILRAGREAVARYRVAPADVDGARKSRGTN